LFVEHSWYFLNALVRANYRNVRKSIEPDMNFLILFFRNLMMGEQNELKNRFMVVNPPVDWIEEQNPTSTRQTPLVVMLYPNNPKHPRQKYRLTVKGLGIYNLR